MAGFPIRVDDPLVVHFTDYRNLPRIIQNGLQCDAAAESMAPHQCGDSGIKARRRHRDVPVGPGGKVCDYAPFYFAPRSPMLFSIKSGNVPNVSPDQDRLVYLVTSLSTLTRHRRAMVITDRNAVLQHAHFGGPAQVEHMIDFDLMGAQYWRNTREDPDRKERRMAECLVHGTVHWAAVERVVVRTRTTHDLVVSATNAATHRPPVSVSSDWYF